MCTCLYLDLCGCTRYSVITVVTLPLAEPVTEIIGESEMYINKESTMNLTCVVRHSPEPPLTIYWTHDHEVGCCVPAERDSHIESATAIQCMHVCTRTCLCIHDRERGGGEEMDVEKGKEEERTTCNGDKLVFHRYSRLIAGTSR